MGRPLREPARTNLPPELVLDGANRGLLSAAPSGGPWEATGEEQPLRGRPELRLHLWAIRPLRAHRGGVPSPVRRRFRVGVGADHTPRGTLLFQGREGPPHSFRQASWGRRSIPSPIGGQALSHRGPVGSRSGGGAGGTTCVYGDGGEQVVKIHAGGEEKPEREEVVEPLVEPTPQRRIERREEPIPEKEPEQVPA